MRYALEIMYNGNRYHGWQKQENAHSVQAEIETAISTIAGQRVETMGCGRTDTGVHAKQFFLHFDIDSPLTDPKFVYRLNRILPNDIAVKEILKVNDQFHARFSCLSRKYEYFICSRKDPFHHEWSYYRHGQLDIELMNECAAWLLEVTNFKVFSKAHTQVYTFNCKLYEAWWEEKPDEGLLVFHVKADRFLRNMVRAMVGTLIDAGRGQLDFASFAAVVKSEDRKRAGFSVPAKGLFLAGVDYNWQQHLINE